MSETSTPPQPAPPLPQPDLHTQAFWDACREKRLEVSACRDCDHLFLPPGPCCPACWSTSLATRAVSGTGTVYSYVVYRRTYHPGMPAPYVVAIIALDEGPRMISNIVGCEPEAVAVDMPVRLRFEAAGAFWLPRFEPLATDRSVAR